MRSHLITVSALLAGLVGCGEESDKRIPNISIDTPTSVLESVDESYTIEVSFSDVVLGDTWSLYYVSDATESKKQAIVADFSVTNRTILWETADLPAGVYSLYGELVSLGGIQTATSAGTLSVSHPGEGNSSPSVQITSPSTGTSITSGSTSNVVFTAADADNDAVTVALEYSADNGNTWSEVADGITSPYVWTVDETYTAGPNYRIRLTVTDSNGVSSSSVSGRFTIL